MQSNFAPLFNALILSTAAAVGMVGMVGNAEAAHFGGGMSRSRMSFSMPSAPTKTVSVQPAKRATPPDAPAQAPAQSVAPATTRRENHDAPTAQLNNAAASKVSASPSRAHANPHDSSTWGFWDSYWTYRLLTANRPAQVSTGSQQSQPQYYTPKTTSESDMIGACVNNHLIKAGVPTGQIELNMSHIEALTARFSSARIANKQVSTSNMPALDQKILNAYKTCTYDWTN